MRVVVTGASGLVGRALIPSLVSNGHEVVAVRGPRTADPIGTSGSPVVERRIDLTQPLDPSLFDGVDAVAHLAARADRHAFGPQAASAYRATNVEASVRLGAAAAKAGVGTFVFVSSIYVNGEETLLAPFSEADRPRPYGDYGNSKYLAEQGLRALEAETGLLATIVRPSIIVGPSVRGGIRLLCGAIDRGIPLPIAGLDNRRNLTGLGNFVRFIELCLMSPHAAGETFLMCDQPAVSTGDLASRLAKALGRQDRQIAVPTGLLRAGAKLLGRQDELGVLWKSQTLHTRHAETKLGWVQPSSLDETLAIAANGYRAAKTLRPLKSSR